MVTCVRSMATTTQDIAFDVNLIQNSTLVDGTLAGWAPSGSPTTALFVRDDDTAKLTTTTTTSLHGSKPSGRYVLVTGRADEKDGLRQAIPAGVLRPRVTYRVAGWVRLGSSTAPPSPSPGEEEARSSRHTVRVSLSLDDDDGDDSVDGGAVCAGAGGWTEINGAFRIKASPRRCWAVCVHGAPAGVDVKVMDLRIFATDRTARFRQLKDKTDKARKRDVVLKFSAAATAGGISGGGESSTSVRVVQMDSGFPFGTCINGAVIHEPAFVDFFSNHFGWAVFENELKWYHTEAQQGQLNYRDADELLELCDRLGKPARGHCVFWAVDGDVQQWVKDLPRDELMAAVKGRLNGLLSRYAGRFPHYDVNNEMLHGRFYRDRLGDDAAAFMFREAARLDPGASLFVNDYNVECGGDPDATPEKYMELIAALQRGGAAVGGIGLQGHVSSPVVGEVICAALDKLAATDLPIWITELDVCEPDVELRADDLEVVLREAYAHPAVGGVVLWGFMQGHMWRRDAYLVDADGAVNEAGQRFVDLQKEWRSDARGIVDGGGNFRFRGFHGTYVVQITTAAGKTMLKIFTVEKGDAPLELDIDMLEPNLTNY